MKTAIGDLKKVQWHDFEVLWFREQAVISCPAFTIWFPAAKAICLSNPISNLPLVGGDQSE